MRVTRYVSSKFTVEDYEMLKKKAEELRIPVGALIRMYVMRSLRGEQGGN